MKWIRTMVCALGMLACVSLSAFAAEYGEPNITTKTTMKELRENPSIKGCIVVVIIFGTVMSFSCYMEGVRLIGGSKASLLASVEPLTATAMSVIFMHVAFSGMDLAGFVGIIAGVIILSLPKKK